MGQPELSDREKFDAVMYQQFKPDPPKKPKIKRGWQVLGYLIIAGIVALIVCFLFGQQ